MKAQVDCLSLNIETHATNSDYIKKSYLVSLYYYIVSSNKLFVLLCYLKYSQIISNIYYKNINNAIFR